MDYEEGKLFERILTQQEQILEMLKTIGDMVYLSIPKETKKPKKKKNNYEEDEEIDELTEEEKIDLEIESTNRVKNYGK